MKCKSCSRSIDNDSIYCKWCGAKQLRERKKKDVIKVPKPRQLKSGSWNIQLREEGQSGALHRQGHRDSRRFP